MRTINIDGHTFDLDLLTGAKIIDAGCKGWNFSSYFADRGFDVYAIDMDNFNEWPRNVCYTKAALVHNRTFVAAHFFGDGSGNFVKGVNEQPYNGEDRPCRTTVVDCITMDQVYKEIGTNIDLLKLDIEGSEYEILANLEPIPRQITVEFHEHCHAVTHSLWIEKVLDHMSKYYTLTQHPCDNWPRYKFMDCLFIRKDLI